MSRKVGSNGILLGGEMRLFGRSNISRCSKKLDVWNCHRLHRRIPLDPTFLDILKLFQNLLYRHPLIFIFWSFIFYFLDSFWDNSDIIFSLVCKVS